LRGNEERFAFSCVWELTREAEIISTYFCKSIIRSRQAMTYEEAQLKIDDLTQQDILSKSLRGLNSLAKILKKRRIENGYVCLRTKHGVFKFE
jgi:exosome complex exonuclease DIS3/RRP44